MGAPQAARPPDDVQWLVLLLRRLALMAIALIEERYPHLRGRHCPHCNQPLLK